MSALLRDAPIGQIIRYLTKNRVLQYPEEKPDFQLPSSYRIGIAPAVERQGSNAEAAIQYNEEKLEEPVLTPGHSLATPATMKDEENPMEKARRARTHGSSDSDSTDPDHPAGPLGDLSLSQTVTRPQMQKVTTRADLERAYTAATKQQSVKSQAPQAIVPEQTSDGVILVDWYTTDDSENPQNWSTRKKSVVALQIYLYTLAVYMGSAIYTPSEPYLEAIFGISPTVGSLGLSLYVLGYGTGPMIFSPMSEIPVVGRNPPYMVTFGIFVILCVPTALVNDVAGFMVLRFLQGFFGSPCLATGGASLGDIFSLLKLPYALTIWAAFATCGPALGPLISGFSVPAENWHWSLWEMLWLAGPIFISLFFFLPETSSPNILLRRAKRLRKLTGNDNLRAQSEIDQAKMTLRSLVAENLYRPMQIMILDPAVLFTAVYTSLVYAIFYSFFEVFPIVYVGYYGFNLGELGLTFLSITVAVIIGGGLYFAYLHYVFEPEVMTRGLLAPERRLVPALPASMLLPVGLFIFGWTGRASIHWIVSVIGVAIYGIGIFVLLQCIFIYVPLSYPQYAASMFAGNDFARSALASGAVLFARPLYINLGVGPGVSLLAGLTCGCILGIFALYYFGGALRARSRFAAK